jgi:hypothetical protein
MVTAKLEGRDFTEAWQLAIVGNVCDSYSSARGASARQLVDVQLGIQAGPPDLRPSTGQKRCAGCVHVRGAGQGLAHCALFGVAVYPGVLWPHRTHDRHEWQAAIVGDPEDPDSPGSRAEWRAAYEDKPTAVGCLVEILLAASKDEGDDPLEGDRGSIAA